MAFQNLSTVLEDLTSRFIINIPEEELASIERVIFQIEQAHWFYEDFIRGTNLKLPSTSLKNFSLLLFQSCVLLRHWVAEHERAFTTFMEYKVKVPVCGAIILNPDLTKVLLVRGWKSNATWGFPKGKINQDEKQTSCAIREVFEEIGFDCSPYLRENEYLERKIHDQTVRLYMITGIDESVEFITQTRKEIGDIKWHNINTLPGYQKGSEEANATITKNKKYKFYMVTPFMGQIKKWIGKFKDARKKGSDRNKAGLKVVDTPEYSTTDDNAMMNDQSYGFGNDYNSAIVPPNQRVEMEESLRNLLGMYEPAMFNGGMNTMMNGMNQINGMNPMMNGIPPFPQPHMNPHIYVHPDNQPQYFPPPTGLQYQIQPQYGMYPNAYMYPNTNQLLQPQQPIQDVLNQPLRDLDLTEEEQEQPDVQPSSEDVPSPPGEDTPEKNSLVDLLLAGRKSADAESEKETAEKDSLLSLLVGSKTITPKNPEKDALMNILMPPNTAIPMEKNGEPSLVDMLVNDRFSSTKKILSSQKQPETQSNGKLQQNSPKKEKKKALPVGPEFGKVQILKRPNEVKKSAPTDSPVISAKPTLDNTNSEKSALQNILLGDVEPTLSPIEENPPVFKLKKKEKPKKVITRTPSQVVDPKSPDPGLEMALNGIGTLVTPHTPIDRALSSALSGNFTLPAPSPMTKEKQSLLDILQGVPEPPVHSPVDESRDVRPSRESRGSADSYGSAGRNSVSGNGISTGRSSINGNSMSIEKQEEKDGLLSLLLGTGTAKSSSSSIPSPGSLSKNSSQQNSLLDILKGIPSPPKNDE